MHTRAAAIIHLRDHVEEITTRTLWATSKREVMGKVVDVVATAWVNLVVPVTPRRSAKTTASTFTSTNFAFPAHVQDTSNHHHPAAARGHCASCSSRGTDMERRWPVCVSHEGQSHHCCEYGRGLQLTTDTILDLDLPCPDHPSRLVYRKGNEGCQRRKPV